MFSLGNELQPLTLLLRPGPLFLVDNENLTAVLGKESPYYGRTGTPWGPRRSPERVVLTLPQTIQIGHIWVALCSGPIIGVTPLTLSIESMKGVQTERHWRRRRFELISFSRHFGFRWGTSLLGPCPWKCKILWDNAVRRADYALSAKFPAGLVIVTCFQGPYLAGMRLGSEATSQNQRIFWVGRDTRIIQSNSWRHENHRVQLLAP